MKIKVTKMVGRQVKEITVGRKALKIIIEDKKSGLIIRVAQRGSK